jgi:tetratricopeptide (TPR) repeat protein
MENSNILLELLQKNKLSEEEQQQLNLLIQSDPELAKLYGSYKKISNTVKYHSHLSTGEISEYVLYKNGLSTDGTGIIMHAPRIEEHLRICKRCEDEFKELNSEFVESEAFIDAALLKPISGDSKGNSSVSGILRRPYSLKIAFATTVIILLFTVAAVIINLTRPSYYDLAKLTDKSELSITRGRATDDFQKGIEAYDDGNYSKAAAFFDNDIKFNDNESTIFYTYYILGLTNLEFAQKNTTDLFPAFNKGKALISITNMKICIQKNNTGAFPDINLNAYYYLAKAYLMLGNKEEAVSCLKNVITGKGSKMDDAAKILNKLK